MKAETNERIAQRSGSWARTSIIPGRRRGRRRPTPGLRRGRLTALPRRWQLGPSRKAMYSARMDEWSPIVSEFESAEQQASYERWLHEKVAKALADPRAPIPHDEVMAKIRAIIEKAKSRSAG